MSIGWRYLGMSTRPTHISCRAQLVPLLRNLPHEVVALSSEDDITTTELSRSSGTSLYRWLLLAALAVPAGRNLAGQRAQFRSGPETFPLAYAVRPAAKPARAKTGGADQNMTGARMESLVRSRRHGADRPRRGRLFLPPTAAAHPRVMAASTPGCCCCPRCSWSACSSWRCSIPILKLSGWNSTPAKVLILQDISSSMDLRDDGSSTRTERASRLIQQLEAGAPPSIHFEVTAVRHHAARGRLPSEERCCSRHRSSGHVLRHWALRRTSPMRTARSWSPMAATKRWIWPMCPPCRWPSSASAHRPIPGTTSASEQLRRRPRSRRKASSISRPTFMRGPARTRI